MGQRRRRRRLLTLACLLLAVVTVSPSPAGADRGVAINLGAIDVGDELLPGGRYSLPELTVQNPGSEPSDYTLQVRPLGDVDGAPPPVEWFSFSPDAFRLEAGETQRVRTSMTVPTRARPGDYQGAIVAEITPEGEGARVGAAAATRLTFTVRPANLLHAWITWVSAFLARFDPWAYALLGVLVAAAGGWRLSRRFELSVHRRSG